MLGFMLQKGSKGHIKFFDTRGNFKRASYMYHRCIGLWSKMPCIACDDTKPVPVSTIFFSDKSPDFSTTDTRLNLDFQIASKSNWSKPYETADFPSFYTLYTLIVLFLRFSPKTRWRPGTKLKLDCIFCYIYAGVWTEVYLPWVELIVVTNVNTSISDVTSVKDAGREMNVCAVIVLLLVGGLMIEGLYLVIWGKTYFINESNSYHIIIWCFCLVAFDSTSLFDLSPFFNFRYCPNNKGMNWLNFK